MYDYRFRQTDLSSGKRRQPPRKALVRAAGIILVIALAYAGLNMDLPWTTTTPVSSSDSDLVPLRLPPQPIAPQDPTPAGTDSRRPA